MRRMSSLRVVMVFALGACAAIAISALSGCAAKKGPAAEAGLLLQYRFQEGSPVTYRNTQTANQTMEVMGQSMNVTTDKSMTFTVMPGKPAGGKQHLTVTIDSVEAGMTVPQGTFSADADAVIGKSFEMEISSVGKELDITGADMIKYSLGAAGERSIKPDFQAIFPDLAGKPLKAGDTWTTSDTLDIDEAGMKLQIISENLNTFEGMEMMEGMDCARISATSVGTVKGSGEQQGAPVAIDSNLEGKDLWFFAASGMLVKMTSDVSMGGTVTVGGAQGMSMPMKQQMKTETALVR